jgi:hypothetical protein
LISDLELAERAYEKLKAENAELRERLSALAPHRIDDSEHPVPMGVEVLLMYAPDGITHQVTKYGTGIYTEAFGLSDILPALKDGGSKT